MDFSITSEQEAIRTEVIQFAKKHLNNEDDLDIFSRDAWKKLSDFGLLGLIVSEEYDGMGACYLTAAIVMEALGYASKNNGLVFAVTNHIWVGLNLVYLYGSKEIKQKYVKKMVHGQLIGAIAITEADAGSDAHAMKSTAVDAGNEYVLNGSKMFISNGNIADIFIVFAKIDSLPNKSITAFVVEKSFEGVNVGNEIEKMGLNSCPMCEVSFQNCRIPKENILGSVGAGDILMRSALEWERCYEFAPHVGAMQRVLESCVVYANQRSQFGNQLTSFQAITHKIADMKMKVELARLMLYKIAWQKNKGKIAFIEASIFKLFVSESYIQTCRDALQIFGAYGYTTEYGIEREMRDALACSIYSGTNEMQRNTIFMLYNMEMQSQKRMGDI